jgi:ketosteroid isomerase-like protein
MNQSQINPPRPAGRYTGPALPNTEFTESRSHGPAAMSASSPGNGRREAISTKDVLDRHLRNFGERNLDGILADYAPGAVLFTADGPLLGVDAIRPLFRTMIAEFGKPGASFSMKHAAVEGDFAYIRWSAETAENVYELGTDTFVVKDGKIVAQSFTGKITPKA